MAMLAEKRTKTRYYLHHKTLNPRGNAWCEDSGKFGQRMLEKMGWSQGKGLGANEDGSTDPVHVSYKWDNKGMGFKGRDGDEAVAQQKDFDALLATLSQETGGITDESNPSNEKPKSANEKPSSSLELRSQKSRARVHYHKFTRGKDLSRASSKDLACILGLPADSQLTASEETEPSYIVPDVGPQIEASIETTFGITTIARGNINEYFKQKHIERKRKAESQETPAGSKKKKVSDNINDTNAFGTDVEMEVPDQGPVSESVDEQIEKSTKKKKKKKRKDEELVIEKITEESESTPRDRRKSVTWGDVEVSFVSKYIKDMADTSSESVNGEILPEACEAENFDTPSKKKKKKNRKTIETETNNDVNSNGMSESSDEVISYETNAVSCTKEKKKKKKRENGVCVVTTDNEHKTSNIVLNGASDEHLEWNISPSNITQKTKRKKKRKNEEVDKLDASNPEETLNAEVQEKKKRKKCKEICVKPDDTSFMPSLSSGFETSSDSSRKTKRQLINLGSLMGEEHLDKEKPTHLLKSKKKKKIKSMDDEVTIIKTQEVITLDDSPLETDKKKKKKKRNAEEKHCDKSTNSNFIESSCINNIEDIEEIQSAKKKKKHEKSLPAPEGNESAGKKKKKKNVLCEAVQEDTSPSANEASKQPSLSALTQERMAKWKERTKDKDMKSIKKVDSKEGQSKTENTSTVTLKVNPDVPVQNYNHRRVLSALGYNVKNAVDKSITVEMPSSNFPGSNLDSLPGYGQIIKSN